MFLSGVEVMSAKVKPQGHDDADNAKERALMVASSYHNKYKRAMRGRSSCLKFLGSTSLESGRLAARIDEMTISSSNKLFLLSELTSFHRKG